MESAWVAMAEVENAALFEYVSMVLALEVIALKLAVAYATALRGRLQELLAEAARQAARTAGNA